MDFLFLVAIVAVFGGAVWALTRKATKKSSGGFFGGGGSVPEDDPKKGPEQAE